MPVRKAHALWRLHRVPLKAPLPCQTMPGRAKHAFVHMKRTFMATMDVPQKKKGEISSSPDASCEAKVGSEVVCSTASDSSRLLTLSPASGWSANKSFISQNAETCHDLQMLSKHGCCSLC